MNASLPESTQVGVGVLGASGYTGAELVRLLSEHPNARLLAVGSRQAAGRALCEVLPALPHLTIPVDADPEDPQAWVERGVTVVFSALPHGAFAARARAFLDAGIRVVDLSADFRVRDAASYASRYQFEHPAPSLLPQAVYGLPEYRGSQIRHATLVANPGCYATAILLGVLPAIAAGWHGSGPVIVTAVSGVSGAGRAPKLAAHFAECSNSVAPYRVGEEHVHLGEIKQTMDDVAPTEGTFSVVFNPHLVPMARGILATLAIPLRRPVSLSEARTTYQQHYQQAAFVRLLDGEALPETRFVRGSNRCDLALRVVDSGRMLLIFSAIDNLLKGAAGQAVQNFNLMHGVAETTGLAVGGWACA